MQSAQGTYSSKGPTAFDHIVKPDLIALDVGDDDFSECRLGRLTLASRFTQDTCMPTPNSILELALCLDNRCLPER
jgi:hypothetical protein